MAHPIRPLHLCLTCRKRLPWSAFSSPRHRRCLACHFRLTDERRKDGVRGLETLAGESWRAIGGWEGDYEVSNLGRVRSLTRMSENGRGTPRRVCGRVLHPSKNRPGYLGISLERSGEEPIRYLLHRLVARAFIGAIPPGYAVNHINGVKSDNRVGNLQITTNSENERHSYKALGKQAVHGSAHWAAKLTEAEIPVIRFLYASGHYSLRYLAGRYSVDIKTIHHIVRRESWKHVF